MALKVATGLADKFKAAVDSGSYANASTLLSDLKLKLIQLPALPPAFQPSPTAKEELLLARDVLEYAVVLSVHQSDEAAFERNFLQLKTYYTDTRSIIPPSSKEAAMTGLNLLRLLVQNRIAEFHTELETIPFEAQKDPYIAHAIQLEQSLMEGAYHKVLQSRQQLPSQLHNKMTEQLPKTISDEIASCCEKAYDRLQLKDAQQLLMLESPAAVLEYAEQHNWDVRDGWIVLHKDSQTTHKDMPSMQLIHNTLVYAKELERIV